MVDRRELPRVATLYEAFARDAPPSPRGGKLRFAGVDGRDVYNITAPFRSAGRTIIAGRVERRDSEDSQAVFFEERDGIWHPIEGAPRFALQDPFVTHIGGELIFGGVRIAHEPYGLIWCTVLYRGTDIFDLREFFVGPIGMKDLRLCGLTDGRIGVFTRPRGLKGGRGTIGYCEVNCLDDLNIAIIEDAALIDDMFHLHDWGGVNETHLLETGAIGLLAHAAYFEGDNPAGRRRYYAAAFTFDPATRQWQDYRIIAARSQFAPGPAKRPDLVDVVFTAGLERFNSIAKLYAGTSDAEAQWIEIDDPFSSLEHRASEASAR